MGKMNDRPQRPHSSNLILLFLEVLSRERLKTLSRPLCGHILNDHLLQTYLEAVRTVESLQHLPEGNGCLLLATGWTQLLAVLVELLLILPLTGLFVTQGGDVPQVARHDLAP